MSRMARGSVAGSFLLVAAIALGGCGGGGNVYVGVGVAGPWVGPGYPGYYPPPVMGPRPPCCWDEDGPDEVQDAAPEYEAQGDPWDRPDLDALSFPEWVGLTMGMPR